MTRVKAVKNTLFPGRSNYTGPTEGCFAFLHHEQLCEWSHDVYERIDYVKRNKPMNEVAIRLHNMIYLGSCEAMAKLATRDADYEAKHAMLYADYAAKRAPLYINYEAKRAMLYADYAAKYATLDADYEAKRALLYADYEAKCTPVYADYKAKLAPLNADFEAKRATLCTEILVYIKLNIPDCAWNSGTLVFPNIEP